MKEASPAAIEEAYLPTEKRIRQAVWGIVFSVALPCIPIIVITIVLLYIIFKYRIHISPGFEGLQPPKNNTHVHLDASDLITLIRKNGFGRYYYVKFNPSTITTIAVGTSYCSRTTNLTDGSHGPPALFHIYRARSWLWWPFTPQDILWSSQSVVMNMVQACQRRSS
jgi:hypothetical protein